MIATMMVEAAIDAGILFACLDHVLCPALAPIDVIVMDNIRSRKVAGVRERIEGVGASVRYLPPTRPTSILSKKHGRNANSNFEP